MASDGEVRAMQLTPCEQQILRELADTLRRDLGATEVLLYGSAARGQLEEGSDIDLLVVLPEVNWEIEKQVTDCCFQAELKCERIISAICFTEAELTHTPLRASPFVLNARKEGIQL
jgi:predicted nucleotidyltransferase